MRHLGHHAADGRIIRALDHLVQPGKAQTLNHQLLLDRGTNGGTYPFQMDFGAATWTLFLCQFMRHDYSSSTDLPRMAATSLRFFKCLSASNVALITLCGLVVPMDLVSTFCTPAEVMTARTAPPAMTPVPSGAGFSSTRPEPNRPSTRCGIVVCVRLTRIKFFFADSSPLRIA